MFRILRFVSPIGTGVQNSGHINISLLGKIASSVSLSASSSSHAHNYGNLRTLSISSSHRRSATRRYMSRNKFAKAQAGLDRDPSRISQLPGLESTLAPELATSLVLRRAKRDDCSTIFKYLRAHALWEGCSDEFEITEEELLREGFGESPCFKCDVVEAVGKGDVTSIVGYAMYQIAFCAWKGRNLWWENMFIHPDYRDFGIGTIFFHEICKAEYRKGCRRVAGYVDDKEVYVKKWYQDMGFEDITRSYNFHMYSSPSRDYFEKFVTEEAPKDKKRSCRVRVDSFLEEE